MDYDPFVDVQLADGTSVDEWIQAFAFPAVGSVFFAEFLLQHFFFNRHSITEPQHAGSEGQYQPEQALQQGNKAEKQQNVTGIDRVPDPSVDAFSYQTMVRFYRQTIKKLAQCPDSNLTEV